MDHFEFLDQDIEKIKEQLTVSYFREKIGLDDTSGNLLHNTLHIGEDPEKIIYILDFADKNCPEMFSDTDYYGNTPLHCLNNCKDEKVYIHTLNIYKKYPNVLNAKNYDGDTFLPNNLNRSPEIIKFTLDTLKSIGSKILFEKDYEENTILHRLICKDVKSVDLIFQEILNDPNGGKGFFTEWNFKNETFLTSIRNLLSNQDIAHYTLNFIIKTRPELLSDRDNYGNSFCHNLFRYYNLEPAKYILAFLKKNIDWSEFVEILTLTNNEGYTIVHNLLKHNDDIEKLDFCLKFVYTNFPNLLTQVDTLGNTPLFYIFTRRYGYINSSKSIIFVLEFYKKYRPELIFEKNNEGNTFLFNITKDLEIESLEKIFQYLKNTYSVLDPGFPCPVEGCGDKSWLYVLFTQKNHEGNTFLSHYVQKERNIENVKYVLNFLKNSMSSYIFEEKNHKRNTFLHILFSKLKIDSDIKCVLEFIKNVHPQLFHIQNYDGDTILHVLYKSFDPDSVFMKHVETIKYILEFFKDTCPEIFEVKNKDRQTILHCCLKNNKLNILTLEFFLDESLKNIFFFKDVESETFLMSLISSDDFSKENILDVLKFVKNNVSELKCLLEQTNYIGDTILHKAAEHLTHLPDEDSTEIIFFLMDMIKEHCPHIFKQKNKREETFLIYNYDKKVEEYASKV